MATQHAIDEAAIRQRIDKGAEAIRAMDLASVISIYATDIVSFDTVPPLQYVGAEAKKGRFHATIPRCAQKCAHSLAAKHASRIAELVVAPSLRAKAAVFQKDVSEIRLRERNSRDPQVLALCILTVAR